MLGPIAGLSQANPEPAGKGVVGWSPGSGPGACRCNGVVGVPCANWERQGWSGRPLYPCNNLNFTLRMMGALGADCRMANRTNDQREVGKEPELRGRAGSVANN